ncbi:MAG: hypothetical protein QM763_04775 [Agriterribacter sp.]
MKSFIFLASFSLITITANCQIDKKYWLVGGTGSFYTYKDNYTTSGQPSITGRLTEINLAANIGYFFIDKFVAGLRPGINSIKSRGLNSASAGTKEIGFYAGPFVRYYFLNKDRTFNILVDGTYQIGRYTTFAGNGTLRNASIFIGPEIFFNTAVGLEFLLGYQYQKKNIENGQQGFNDERRGLQISVGFQIHLTNN